MHRIEREKRERIFHAEAQRSKGTKAENYGRAWRSTFMKASDIIAGSKKIKIKLQRALTIK
jgi:hypothetical protein